MSQKMSKNDPNLRQLLNFFGKFLSSQTVFSILQFRALWSHFIFSCFCMFKPDQGVNMCTEYLLPNKCPSSVFTILVASEGSRMKIRILHKKVCRIHPRNRLNSFHNKSTTMKRGRHKIPCNMYI